MLPRHAELLKLIDSYELQFTDEKESVNMFREFVNRNLETSIYSRKNFDGHFTASAFLVNEARTHLLFLNHKKLNRWLQPGGHIDDTDSSILKAALREVAEETGLQSVDLELIDAEIFDLDAHVIPENPKKDEPAHVHYDVRFLIKVISESGINVNKAEAEELKWLPIEVVSELEGFQRVTAKLISV